MVRVALVMLLFSAVDSVPPPAKEGAATPLVETHDITTDGSTSAILLRLASLEKEATASREEQTQQAHSIERLQKSLYRMRLQNIDLQALLPGASEGSSLSAGVASQAPLPALPQTPAGSTPPIAAQASGNKDKLVLSGSTQAGARRTQGFANAVLAR